MSCRAVARSREPDTVNQKPGGMRMCTNTSHQLLHKSKGTKHSMYIYAQRMRRCEVKGLRVSYGDKGFK